MPYNLRGKRYCKKRTTITKEWCFCPSERDKEKARSELLFQRNGDLFGTGLFYFITVSVGRNAYFSSPILLPKLQNQNT